ncbi:MAG: PIN domain-containing protein [Caldilineaceae bacterium]
MSEYVTDTHPLIWHLTRKKQLSPTVRQIFLDADAGNCRIYIPGIVLIEMVYLVEKGVLAKPLLEQLLYLLDTPNGSYQLAPESPAIARKMLDDVPWSAIPELADRMITATAVALECGLLTKDERIVDSQVVETIW